MTAMYDLSLFKHLCRVTVASALMPACAWLGLALSETAQAQTALTDSPIESIFSVPGNLALALSVEFPTAVSVAHISNTYTPATTYRGYFDPAKCYTYVASTISGLATEYFTPSGAASIHVCNGAWSGNYLNWATMQTIDPFRWALTGGYRVVDNPGVTILEKAWASGQGGQGNFPDRVLSNSTDIKGATPFNVTNLVAQVQGRGNKISFTQFPDLRGDYYNNMTLSGAPVYTNYVGSVNYNWGQGAPVDPNGNPVTTPDTFSVRWTGSLYAIQSGTYLFRTTSDDGVRLYINGGLVINDWNAHSATDNIGHIDLVAGQTYSITLEFYEAYGSAQIALNWKPPWASDYVLYSQNYYVRAKVCDPALGLKLLESNCVQYGSDYKPEGLIQEYSDRLRYSAFGYLFDSKILRDGGVLRARQKFVGPTQPVPGSTPVANALKEWSPTDGTQIQNPDSADASNTAAPGIVNSGVINYLNKFGEISRNGYKTFDPVGELYYTAVRYFKHIGNISQFSDLSTGGDPATLADGFPVIAAWDDPILYRCQANAILGIGDVNTWADKDVPGAGSLTFDEPPTKPNFAPDDIDAVARTNQVGVMEGLGSSLATKSRYPNCCDGNSALMAGVAYDVHTRDIRTDPQDPKSPGIQTISTYWLDVWEYQTYLPSNQYYLATKYGGFTLPKDWDYNNTFSRTAPLDAAWWHTNTDQNNGQDRPDNYYAAASPDTMVAGLRAAFADFASKASGSSAALGLAQPQVSADASGNASFATLYSATNWTGDVTAYDTSFASADGAVTQAQKWTFSNVLASQAASLGGNWWRDGRAMATWNGAGVPFRLANLSASQISALKTGLTSGDDSSNYLNFLRGDRSNEKNSGGVYRNRTSLLGDITDSKIAVVDKSVLPYSDSANPGYSTFAAANDSRRRMLYVGSNDGMLHGIDGNLDPVSGGGQEVFAYVPSALFSGPTSPATPTVNGLAALGNPGYTHHNYVDATPFTFELDFGNAGGAKGSPDWRTVVIGGLGKGGRSYYALDITNPGASGTWSESDLTKKVLWEFTAPQLGLTYGQPVMVKTRQYGWTLILPSGYNNADGVGYLFIVDPRTGKLLQPAISTGVGAPTAQAGLAHLNAYVLDRTDGYSDAVYGGDLLGNLWRLDISAASGNYAAPKKIAELRDAAGVAQPVTSAPLVEIEPKSKVRYVLLGTGRYLDASDGVSTQGQTFYAIKDGNGATFAKDGDLPATYPFHKSDLQQVLDLSTGITPDAKKVGWYLDLGNNNLSGDANALRMTLSPDSFLGMVLFSAYSVAPSDPCKVPIDSRIYAVDFNKGQTLLKGATEGSTINYVAAPASQIVQNLLLSVGGSAKAYSADSSGSINFIPTNPSPLVPQSLNWREITLSN